jgi:hypothetical protein
MGRGVVGWLASAGSKGLKTEQVNIGQGVVLTILLKLAGTNLYPGSKLVIKIVVLLYQLQLKLQCLSLVNITNFFQKTCHFPIFQRHDIQHSVNIIYSKTHTKCFLSYSSNPN